MPDTSDSEAFESADEDIVDAKPVRKEHSAKLAGSADTLKQDDTIAKSKTVDQDITERFAPTQIDALVTEENVVQPEPKEIPVTKALDVEPDFDQVANVKPSLTKNEEPNTFKRADSEIVDKSKPAPVNGQNPIVESTSNVADDDGWEFDDWAEDAPAATTQPDEQSSVAKNAADDDVGWEVEDWGDEPPTVAEPKQTASSAKKDDAKSVNLFGNLSQMLISSDEPTHSTASKTSNPLDRLAETGDSTSNWGWKPWGGVVNLLSTATDGVASITSHVSSVIESGMGVPDPAEMARIQQQERQKRMQEQQQSTDGDGASSVDAPEEARPAKRGDDASLFLGQFVSGMTHIGNRVITGGLDTLEGIGKKTMHILKENDKGLLDKQRKMLMEGQGPALSQVCVDYTRIQSNSNELHYILYIDSS